MNAIFHCFVFEYFLTNTMNIRTTTKICFWNKLKKKSQHVQQMTSKKQNQTKIQINKRKRKRNTYTPKMYQRVINYCTWWNFDDGNLFLITDIPFEKLLSFIDNFKMILFYLCFSLWLQNRNVFIYAFSWLVNVKINY